jgi:predicted DNA binding CopG/RHH family protein
MPRKSTEPKKFKSEAEEAAWYATPAGRRQTQREYERALRAGAVIQSGDQTALTALMEQAKATATRAVSLRVPVTDLERAKSIAEKQGVGYQTVLKQAIRAGLKKAG